MMTLYTVQLRHWRRVRKEGKYLLDSTVKTGIKSFAPTWAMVMGVKKGEWSEAQYMLEYDTMMTHSAEFESQAWDALRKHSEIAVGCYCAEDVFCHRHLLIPHLTRFLKAAGEDVQCAGELYSQYETTA